MVHCPHIYSKYIFYLPNGKKILWFDNHRKFLPHNHSFRRNKSRFLINKPVSTMRNRDLVGGYGGEGSIGTGSGGDGVDDEQEGLGSWLFPFGQVLSRVLEKKNTTLKYVAICLTGCPTENQTKRINTEIITMIPYQSTVEVTNNVYMLNIY